MLQLHFVHNIVVAHTAAVFVRNLHMRAVGVVGNFLRGPVPIAVVLGSVGSWDLQAGFGTAWKVDLRVEGVVVKEALDHIVVVDCFVGAGLEVVCFVAVVGLAFVVQNEVEDHVVKGTVGVGIVMVDPAE